MVTTFDVYEDFFSYTGGVYEHSWGDLEAGHCVAIVGWSNTNSCWICKNSWGTDWGEDGWFRIRWGNCGINSGVRWMAPSPFHLYGYVQYKNKDDDVDERLAGARVDLYHQDGDSISSTFTREGGVEDGKFVFDGDSYSGLWPFHLTIQEQ